MNEKAERLYERARGLDPESRGVLLEEACRGDLRLRDELQALLAEAQAAEEFFQLLENAVLSTRFPLDEPNKAEDSETAQRFPPFPLAELPEGTILGHYRILSFIGSGGMGAVYRAHDTVLERQVALKFLPPLSTRLDDEERLLKEARSAAALEHPNVCTIHEIGQTDDGRPFIAMALYEGETLKERLRRGPLSVQEAVAVGVQIARGLEVAHARGILHRDVKPGNVIMGTDGTTRLLDFGLAMVTDATLSEIEGTQGTLAYMSPEQVRGDSLDPRTDLWSLGVVLYELLAGRRPFRGENERALFQSILEEEPKPLSETAEVPAPLARVVSRLLSKVPSGRYQSAAEVVSDLTQAVPWGSSLGHRVRPRRRKALLVGSAGALALLGIVLWLPGRLELPITGASDAPSEPSLAVLPLANLSADPRDEVLADGMTEELIAILSRTEGLRVVSSTSALAFNGRPGNMRSIADSLGVSNVLEGDVQKIGSRLRVRVRLVDPRDGSTRWSETYDREFEDVFGVQDEIAGAVAGELDRRLTGSANTQSLRHQTANVAAYELYLRGRDRTLTRSDSGVREAVGYFKQAIAADSTYAPAYAGLATAYVRMGWNREPDRPLRELHALAEEAARKAATLDDSLAEAHWALGRVREAEFDFVSAETEIRRAIALDPTDHRFRKALVVQHIWAGRPEKALADARRALELDPLSPNAHAEVAHALFANHRYDEALAQLERIVAMRPPLLAASAIAGQCYAKKGMWSAAIAALRPHAESGEPVHLALLGHTLARAGQRDEAIRILTELHARRQRHGVGAFELATVYAGLGDLDQAFVWLDRSVDDRSLKYQIMEPTFEELRKDPRFERLTKRISL